MNKGKRIPSTSNTKLKKSNCQANHSEAKTYKKARYRERERQEAEAIKEERKPPRRCDHPKRRRADQQKITTRLMGHKIGETNQG